MSSYEPTTVDKLAALRDEYHTLRAAYLRLEAELDTARAGTQQATNAIRQLQDVNADLRDERDTARAEVEQQGERLKAIGAETESKTGGLVLYLRLARQLITRILAAQANTDPADTADVDLRLYAIINERDHLRAEVERLKAEHIADQETIDRADEHTRMLMTEIERLTAALSASEAQVVQGKREAFRQGVEWRHYYGRILDGGYRHDLEAECDRRYPLPAGEV